MTDRVEQLRRAARARHDTALARATHTLETLARGNQPISFGRLARTAGVSRSWIYRQPELREQVEKLRQSPPPKKPNKQSGQRASDDSLRQQVHLYREHISRLQAENRALKEQLARQLGIARAAAVTKQP